MNDFVISELVRIAIAAIALTANWEVLQSTNLTDEQLAAIAKRLGRVWILSEREKTPWQWNA